jgi:hypothetical protein
VWCCVMKVPELGLPRTVENESGLEASRHVALLIALELMKRWLRTNVSFDMLNISY